MVASVPVSVKHMTDLISFNKGIVKKYVKGCVDIVSALVLINLYPSRISQIRGQD